MRAKFNIWLQFLKRLCALATPYFKQSNEKWIARGLLVAITTLNIGLVYIAVLLNQWNATFYNSLEARDFKLFTHQLWVFAGFASIYILFAVYQLYLSQMLQIRWRRWLTEEYFDRWFNQRLFYHLELKARDKTDNPDQRIAQDIQILTSDTLNIFFGLLNAGLTLISFTAILWALSGPLKIASITIPGYMFWTALIYAFFGTWIAHLIGYRLIGIHFNLEKYQADFRYNLVRLRENAEAIALYSGEHSEKQSLMNRFGSIWTTWWALMKTQKQLTWFTASYSQIAVIFPILVAAPRFFRGSIDLGTLMQIALAFGQVQNSLSWFIHSYSGLADWKASVDRLLNFDDRLDQLKTEMAAQQNIHVFQDKENTGVKINLKQLLIPSGEALLENIQLEFFQGEHLLITGPSGCGKSTLFRALAGIWPFGQGEVKTPRGKILFLPQKPYLPIGSLKEALSYPSTLKDFSDAELKEALGLCSLNYLTEKMAIKENWAQQLSPGEQQRLAFARAILHRPDWLFMDESTSSVDPELEKNLYETLQKKLPDCTLVSIAHRPNVAHYHSKRLRFVKDAELSKLVVESI